MRLNIKGNHEYLMISKGSRKKTSFFNGRAIKEGRELVPAIKGKKLMKKKIPTAKVPSAIKLEGGGG